MITPGTFKSVVEIIRVEFIKGPSGSRDRKETIIGSVFAEVKEVTDDVEVQLNTSPLKSIVVTTYNYPVISTNELLLIDGKKYNVQSREDTEDIYSIIHAKEYSKS